MVRFAATALLLLAVTHCVTEEKKQHLRRTKSVEGNACSSKNPCKKKRKFFCNLPDGQCGETLATKPRICERYSECGGTCPGIKWWVCGCDGKVYRNAVSFDDMVIPIFTSIFCPDPHPLILDSGSA